MNEIREIVTKAIVEKGKKQIRFIEKIETKNPVESVLGCWVLNHSFQAEKTKDGVLVQGIFEVNIWYSFNNNSQTDIAKEMINYQQEINTKRKVNEYEEHSTDVIVRMVQPPVCSDVKIVDNLIEIEVLLEVSAEVIGETKMKVTVLDLAPDNDTDDDDLEDIDNQINQQFLRERIF
ncbi:MAG TPA: outer spore coat protein CotE [Haloplasmataceae bacterium]